MLGRVNSKIRKIVNKRFLKRNFWFDWKTVKLFYCLKLKKLIKRWQLAFDKVYFYYPIQLSFRPLVGLVLLSLIFTQVLGVNAFEAHIINVTARIVNDLPVIEMKGGDFCLSTTLDVTISSSIASSTIAYSINGSDPDCGGSGLIYTEPVQINYNTLLKARACRDNGSQGPVVSELFMFSTEYCKSCCGDGTLDDGEECDDGNNDDGDGCSSECLIESDCEIEVGDFCSQTQGGWGQESKGHNTGYLRENNWDTVVGGSLLVGNGFSIIFSGSSAVEVYLPAGGTPESLIQNHADPLITEAGILAGQVTALKLNVLFSDAGIGKITLADSMPLRQLIIASGKFKSMTVGDFLVLAEAVLGGDISSLSTYGVSISDVNDVADKINNNFTDCEANQGFLMLPLCVPKAQNIVLNEFLPNPIGNESSLSGADGEWVEIYNNGSFSVDLAGWIVDDEADHNIIISDANTDARDTVIAPKGFLVVYMNQAIFNNTDDTVYLYNSSDILIDSYSYSGAPENKSFARIPDGVGDWVDPIPTPGAPNKTEEVEQSLTVDSGSSSSAGGSKEDGTEDDVVEEDLVEEIDNEEVSSEEEIEAGGEEVKVGDEDDSGETNDEAIN